MFTRYYIDLLNYGAKSLDPSPLTDLSLNCQTCSELAKSYADTKAAGRQFVGGNISVDGTGSAVVNGDEGETSFVLTQNPTSVADSSGAIVETRSTAVKKYSGGVRLSWDRGRMTWLMTQLDADPL